MADDKLKEVSIKIKEEHSSHLRAAWAYKFGADAAKNLEKSIDNFFKEQLAKIVKEYDEAMIARDVKAIDFAE